MEKQSLVSPATLPERAAAQEYRAAVEHQVLSGQFSLLIGCFRRFYYVTGRRRKCLEVLESGEMVGRVGIEPTTN